MRTYKEKLESLDEYSCWVFTKQDTDFDEAFKAVKLFSEIPSKETTNIEYYFADNHERYGINTDRHRMLVIPQLYGLLTKTPFFERGGNYANENPTAVFDKHKNLEIGSTEYNIFKTEQLLKIKIHAIIDTSGNNSGYNILPIVFIYKVLKTLKNEYGISAISLNQLYTYVMTCKEYSEWEEAVYFLKERAPISNYVEEYKSRSRVLTFIKNNTNLFQVTKTTIAINPLFEEYFYNNFINRFDFEELHSLIQRDVDYSYFLHNNQKFGMNIIDVPNGSECVAINPISISPFIDEDENETDYIDKVNEIDEKNINENAGDGAHKNKPVVVVGFDKKKKYKTNPLLGKIAIKKSCYKCAIEHTHSTFLSKKTRKPYMEAHHLVPVCNQSEMWDKYGVNIDCVENLISLCPTCHKAFHYGTEEVKRALIEEVYEQTKNKYHEIGLNITLEELLRLYNVRNK